MRCASQQRSTRTLGLASPTFPNRRLKKAKSVEIESQLETRTFRSILSPRSSLHVATMSRATLFEHGNCCDGYELIVTDLHLRWGDGHEIVSAFRQNHPQCAIVTFTGDEMTAVELMKSGVDRSAVFGTYVKLTMSAYENRCNPRGPWG